jgi:hypothetical protein
MNGQEAHMGRIFHELPSIFKCIHIIDLESMYVWIVMLISVVILRLFRSHVVAKFSIWFHLSSNFDNSPFLINKTSKENNYRYELVIQYSLSEKYNVPEIQQKNLGLFGRKISNISHSASIVLQKISKISLLI